MDDFSTAQRMLRLPLRRPAGCGCAVAALALAALLALAWAGYAWIGAGWSASPPPQAAAHLSLTAEAATPSPPAGSPSPAPATTTLPPATATGTPSPVPTSTALPTSTPTAPPSPTHTPSATPIHTATPSPTLQPTATRAVPAATAAGRVACSAEIRAAIERALEAQAQYMEGVLDAAALSAAWGGAAADAEEEADQLLAYGQGFSPPVELEDVAWTLVECQMLQQPGWVRVETSERWAYEATIECAPDEPRSTVRVEHFPAQRYALSPSDDTWRINSWLTGPAEVERQWRCPS